MRLNGKRAVITGAGGGIGRVPSAIALGEAGGIGRVPSAIVAGVDPLLFCSEFTLNSEHAARMAIPAMTNIAF